MEVCLLRFLIFEAEVSGSVVVSLNLNYNAEHQTCTPTKLKCCFLDLSLHLIQICELFLQNINSVELLQIVKCWLVVRLYPRSIGYY